MLSWPPPAMNLANAVEVDPLRALDFMEAVTYLFRLKKKEKKIMYY